ncbi:MAG: VWA domain-containing protein [Deltaproteobacteria bacterium]|nr:VWA domain-containing protein [Deltaproteobacteria bacterium]
MIKLMPTKHMFLYNLRAAIRMRFRSDSIAVLAAAALLPVFGLGACFNTSREQDTAKSRSYGTGGNSGAVQKDIDLVSQPAIKGVSAGWGGNAATAPGLPINVDAEEVIEPIADPGPLLCTAPEREAYKATRQQDAVDGQADAAVADASLTLFDPGSDGMEHTVLFIFDKSGSMATNWDGRNKWHVANDTMIASVTPFQSYLSVGAIFFPTDDSCSVASIESGEQIDFRGGEDFLVAWEGSMSRYSAGGATPMSVALRQADQAIARACRLGVLERPFKVAILTDGEPNCDGDPQELTRLPAKWAQHGIKTHVIGLPGSESARAILEAMANAGGTKTFISPSEPDELEDQMMAICI